MIELIIRGAEKVQLTRLWDALSWLDTYDPEATADMESEFGFDVLNRTVDPVNPREGKDAQNPSTEESVDAELVYHAVT